MSVKSCHEFISSTYPALGVNVGQPYPQNFAAFEPIAWSWYSVGPGAKDVGSCGAGICRICKTKLWFSSWDETNTLEFREFDWGEEQLGQMNTVKQNPG